MPRNRSHLRQPRHFIYRNPASSVMPTGAWLPDTRPCKSPRDRFALLRRGFKNDGECVTLNAELACDFKPDIARREGGLEPVPHCSIILGTPSPEIGIIATDRTGVVPA